jgi:hypothetical protein
VGDEHQISTERGHRIKEPEDWVTGGEEMTGAQEYYLETLGAEAHEPVDHDLTKAERIERD